MQSISAAAGVLGCGGFCPLETLGLEVDAARHLDEIPMKPDPWYRRPPGNIGISLAVVAAAALFLVYFKDTLGF